MSLRAGAAALPLGLALMACSTSNGPDCADCTGCGIAGPVNQETLDVAELGGGTNAEPTVRLGVRASGTCKGAALAPKFEVRLVVPPVVTPITDPSSLSPLLGTKESGGTRLADGSLLHAEVVSPSVQRLVFDGVQSGPSDGGLVRRTTTCTLAGATVTCN